MKKIICILFAISILIIGSFSVMAENIDEPRSLRSLFECHELLAKTEIQEEVDVSIESEIQETGDDAVSYKLIHCQSESQTGYYSERLISTEQIGYETSDCIHSVQGAYDVRYQYLDRYEATCTLCDYKANFVETRWGSWNCNN